MARTVAELKEAIFQAELAYVKKPTKRNAEIMRQKVIFLQGELALQEAHEQRQATGMSEQDHRELWDKWATAFDAPTCAEIDRLHEEKERKAYEARQEKETAGWALWDDEDERRAAEDQEFASWKDD